MNRLSLLCTALAATLLMFTGCEEGDGTVALKLTPSEVNLSLDAATNSNNTVTFTVSDGLRDLSLPLEWSVANDSYGRIVSSGGDSASYQALLQTSEGSLVNTVIVRDQYDAEGIATVRQ